MFRTHFLPKLNVTVDHV